MNDNKFMRTAAFMWHDRLGYPMTLQEVCTMRDVLAVHSDETYALLGEAQVERDAARSERDAAMSLLAQMAQALDFLMSELEHEGSDGWMTGCVHIDEYKAAERALAAYKEFQK